VPSKKIEAFSKSILNRRARFEYAISQTYEAGLVLTGTEIKSIRTGKVSLEESFGVVKNDEVLLMEMQISPYAQGNINNHDPKRTRKLLLHKQQIAKIKSALQEKGLTLIPLKIYFTDKGIAKVEIGIAKGKKLYDKRETIKKRDTERDLRRNL
jgi:SsrA-binding protein